MVIPENADWPEDLRGMNLGLTIYSIRNHGAYCTYKDDLEQMDFRFESQLGLIADAAILGVEYEEQVRSALQRGTCISATPIDSTSADLLPIPLPGNSGADVRRFEHIVEVVPDDVVGDPILWIPTKCNFAAIDCVVTCGKDVFFIQITLSQRHDIVLRSVNGKEGLLTMVEALETCGFDVGRQQGIRFVWITPEPFQGSSFPLRGDLNDGDKALAGAIKQYNCIIPMACDAEPTEPKAM